MLIWQSTMPSTWPSMATLHGMFTEVCITPFLLFIFGHLTCCVALRANFELDRTAPTEQIVTQILETAKKASNYTLQDAVDGLKLLRELTVKQEVVDQFKGLLKGGWESAVALE